VAFSLKATMFMHAVPLFRRRIWKIEHWQHQSDKGQRLPGGLSAGGSLRHAGRWGGPGSCFCP